MPPRYTKRAILRLDTMIQSEWITMRRVAVEDIRLIEWEDAAQRAADLQEIRSDLTGVTLVPEESWTCDARSGPLGACELCKRLVAHEGKHSWEK